MKCCRGVLASLSCSCSAALEGMASTVLSSSLEVLSMPSTSTTLPMSSRMRVNDSMQAKDESRRRFFDGADKKKVVRDTPVPNGSIPCLLGVTLVKHLFYALSKLRSSLTRHSESIYKCATMMMNGPAAGVVVFRSSSLFTVPPAD